MKPQQSYDDGDCDDGYDEDDDGEEIQAGKKNDQDGQEDGKGQMKADAKSDDKQDQQDQQSGNNGSSSDEKSDEDGNDGNVINRFKDSAATRESMEPRCETDENYRRNETTLIIKKHVSMCMSVRLHLF